MRKQIFIPSAIAFSLFALVAFSQLSFSSKTKNCTGEVASIKHGGVNDVVFTLRNNNTTFYINRGFESYKIQELNSLVGKTVNIQYTEDQNLFQSSASKEISRLEMNNSVFFPQ